nr:MAG TPA_asm: hypothetical protein [Caudoviricetes sp.]
MQLPIRFATCNGTIREAIVGACPQPTRDT